MNALRMALFLCALGCIIEHVCGCSSPSEAKYPAYCYDEKLLDAAILRCTDKSTTREQSRACKREVNASCGFVETVSKAAAHE